MGIFAVAVLENSIAVIAKVGSFDVPVFGFVFEGSLFDVGGEVGGELPGEGGLVDFGVSFEAVEEDFGVGSRFGRSDQGVIGFLE